MVHIEDVIFNVHHFFYQTAEGVEMDLLFDFSKGPVGFECKSASAPKPTYAYMLCSKIFSTQ
jgi:hypothetical protein